jgi:hypothetical protein
MRRLFDAVRSLPPRLKHCGANRLAAPMRKLHLKQALARRLLSIRCKLPQYHALHLAADSCRQRTEKMREERYDV